MNSNTKDAITQLKKYNFTCVLKSETELLTSTENGIKPLLKLLSLKKDFKGYSAADKIVGKAAAMLYVLLGVSEVYAPVMSESALYTLSKNGIIPICETSVAKIINRQCNGICPMEQTVADIKDPNKAFYALKEKIAKMN